MISKKEFDLLLQEISQIENKIIWASYFNNSPFFLFGPI